jgi:hypothetical protein
VYHTAVQNAVRTLFIVILMQLDDYLMQLNYYPMWLDYLARVYDYPT